MLFRNYIGKNKSIHLKKKLQNSWNNTKKISAINIYRSIHMYLNENIFHRCGIICLIVECVTQHEEARARVYLCVCVSFINVNNNLSRSYTSNKEKKKKLPFTFFFFVIVCFVNSQEQPCLRVLICNI